MAKLKRLALIGSPLSKKENYAEQVFKALPQLEVLDGLNKKGEEVFDDESESEEFEDEVNAEGNGEEDGESSSEEEAEAKNFIGGARRALAGSENPAGVIEISSSEEGEEVSDSSEEGNSC